MDKKHILKDLLKAMAQDFPELEICFNEKEIDMTDQNLSCIENIKSLLVRFDALESKVKIIEDSVIKQNPNPATPISWGIADEQQSYKQRLVNYIINTANESGSTVKGFNWLDGEKVCNIHYAATELKRILIEEQTTKGK